MAFIHTIPPEEATGTLRDLYAEDLKSYGYVRNLTRALSLRAEILAIWHKLIGSVSMNMDSRRFELVTLIAASRLSCTYWTLSHGALLRARYFSENQVVALLNDYRNAGLNPVGLAIVAFAEKMTLHAYKVTQNDIDELRRHGLSDADILDIVLAVGARNFFSKVLDAIGAEPDAEYLRQEVGLRQALVVGRPPSTSD